jgi:hypothetical protein
MPLEEVNIVSHGHLVNWGEGHVGHGLIYVDLSK